MKFFQMCNVFLNFDDAKAIHVLSLSQNHMKNNEGYSKLLFLFYHFLSSCDGGGIRTLDLRIMS
jgi:hypothetical protein